MSSSKRKHSGDGGESENEGKSRNRSVTEGRERQWQTVGSSDDESHSTGSSSSSDSESCSESEDDRKVKHDDKDSKKAKKDSKHKKSKKDHKDKKERKHNKKDRKKDKKHKKDKKNKKDKKDKRSSSHNSISVNQNEYGKYGIIKEENIFHKQREFEVYMAEVRGVPGVMSEGKREVMLHFKTYMEDYNTATMPHEKYYNYERWEMAEYHRNKLDQQQRAHNNDFDAIPASFNDEEIRRRELKQRKDEAENKEFQLLKQKMAQNKDIQGDMRRQAQLSTELQLAFKRGDSATVKRLERVLAPEEPKMVVKHPWA